MFSLAEEVFLLSLLEKKETLRIPSSLSLPFAIAGATILELIFLGDIRVEDGRLLLAQNIDQDSPDHLKLVMEKIRKLDKPKKVDYWVYQIGARGHRVTKLVLQSLIQKEIIQEDGKNFRWGLPANQDSQDVRISKYLLKRRLRDEIFCETTMDEPSAALFSLMDSCGMLNHLFTEDEMIAGRKRVKRLTNGNELSHSFAEILSLIITGVEYATAAAVSV